MSSLKIFLIGFTIGALGAKAALPVSGPGILIGCLINGLVWGGVFAGGRLVILRAANYFDQREKRDQAKAEAEGFEAASRGQPPESNPYTSENSDHFRGMAQAWFRGYVRTKNKS